MLSKQDIAKFISDDYFSEQKRNARAGTNYYKGRHDINNYRLFYFDGDGILREDKYRSNVKIPHPFFTEIVNQTVQYIFSGGKIVKSDNPELQGYLDEYFNCNEEFLAAISDLVTGCVTKGSEYLYLYRNKEGKLSFQCVDSLCITEVSAQNNDDNEDYVIFSFNDTIGREKRKIKRIQVWDKNSVYFFIQNENGVVTVDDSEKFNPSSHTAFVDENGEAYCESFGFIPFFRLDNNADRTSDLWITKDLIDDYDLMASSLSNNLIDFDMPLYAVTGFEGDSLDELQQNLKTKKIIGLEENGGVEVKTIDVPYQARQIKLELDEKNIYRFGMGLNTVSLKDSSATTNIAIKAAYSLLDLKCAKLEMRLKRFLKEALKPIILEINDQSKKNFNGKDFRFEFKHEILSNAYENAQIKKLIAEENQIKIQTILEVSDILDDETLIRNICDCLEVNYNDVAEKINKKSEKNFQVNKALEDFETKEKTSGTALNGAQMSSLLSILAQYKSGNISADVAAAIISVSFGISEEKAAKLLSAEQSQEVENTL